MPPDPGDVVAVVGLGKIGLPLAVQFAGAGLTVIGCDLDLRVVADVNAGHEPFPGEAGLAGALEEVTAAGRLSATADTRSAVSQARTVVIVVPLYVDEEGTPGFEAIDSATEAVGSGLAPGTTVIYETTLPIGTTRNRLQPLIEKHSGLRIGVDAFLAFSPERVYSGRIFADLKRYPKLVGGVDDRSAERAIDFYRRALTFDQRPDLPQPNGVWNLGSTEAAEFAKLAETTYRDVNIALANVFAEHAEALGVDVYRVIEACNSQPFSHIHQPGIAVGGHCIPVYPQLYLTSHPTAEIVRVARQTNANTPRRVVDLIEQRVGNLTGTTALILGVTYRAGVKETFLSGAFALRDVLASRGVTVFAHDPLIDATALETLGFAPARLPSDADIVIIQNDALEYSSLTVSDVPEAQLIVDGRNVSSSDDERIVTLGIG